MPTSGHLTTNHRSPTEQHCWHIGPYKIKGLAVLAPMAGVSDFPFRKVCLQHGAAMATGEMTASKPELRLTTKSLLRLANADDPEPRVVQIVGTEPEQLADAAEYQVRHGAQIVDINMGCPAKKVCNRLAGSALLADASLVEKILVAVVNRVPVPVTLKIRTGTDPNNRNGLEIAKLAEQCGIQSLAVHGRTRACKFRGQVEYDTIASIADALSIPVIANGDIKSAKQACDVLKKTGATAVMLGRGAQGRPWIFQEINDLLASAKENCGLLTDKSLNLHGSLDLERLIIEHLGEIYRFYDRSLNDMIDNNALKSKKRRIFDESAIKLSVRVARKHICWYFEQLEHMSDLLIGSQLLKNPEQHLFYEKKNCRNQIRSRADKDNGGRDFQGEATLFSAARKQFNQLQCQRSQLEFIDHFFAELRTTGVKTA